MPLATTFPAAVLETILNRLAVLFLAGAGGDSTAARNAASQMLTAYHPDTLDELGLAASIIGFSFQSLEALGQAAAPDIPLTRILRLRGNAVSLSREAEKARRQLDQLRKARRQGAPAQPEAAIDQTEPPASVPVAAKVNGQTWTDARTEENRQQDIRIAASLKKAEARVAAQSHPAVLAAASHHPAQTLARTM